MCVKGAGISGEPETEGKMRREEKTEEVKKRNQESVQNVNLHTGMFRGGKGGKNDN